MMTERMARRALVASALTGLALGVAASLAGRDELAGWIWGASTLPVVVGLLVSIVRELLAGRVGVDTRAFVSMSAALALRATACRALSLR